MIAVPFNPRPKCTYIPSDKLSDYRKIFNFVANCDSCTNIILNFVQKFGIKCVVNKKQHLKKFAIHNIIYYAAKYPFWIVVSIGIVIISIYTEE